MTRYTYIPALFLSAAMALPAVAASGRNIITTEQVAAAINGAGMKVSAEQVMLLTDVVATNSAPELFIPSKSVAMLPRLDPACPVAAAASMATLEFAWSGGIKRVVDT